MVSFIPKFCSLDIKDAELAAIKAQSFQTDMDAVRGEYVFLLDRSGSMSGQAIEKAKEALILFLKSLPIDTYFQVVSFGSEDQKLFDTSQKNSNESISEAITRIGRMQADMGGTQIYRPLQEILQSQLIEGYPKQIFMLTDGGVSNTESVIELVKSNTKYSRVNTIGIGSGVSQSLILRCAQEGKGSHVFIQQNENPSQKIIQMLNNSLSPVISKIHLNYDKNIVQSIIPNPQKLPYFLKGEIVSFFITFKNHLTQKTQISLSYIDSLNNYPFKSSLTIQPEEQNQLFVEKLTNYRKIKALEQSESSKSNLQDYMYFVKKVDKKEQIINLSVKHQILSKYTAFICQEKELVDGKFQQIKDKGKQKIQIVQVNQKIYKRQSEGFFQSLSSMIPMKMMSYDMSPESCQVKQCFENKEVRQQYSRKFQLRMQYYNQDLFDNQIEIHQQNKQKEGWDIKRIVKEQLFDGSWSNKEIISELYSSSILSQLNILKEQKIGITYLITIWIQKHHPSNEYNLIVKKARNWLKKQQNYAQLSSQFDKYLK